MALEDDDDLIKRPRSDDPLKPATGLLLALGIASVDRAFGDGTLGWLLRMWLVHGPRILSNWPRGEGRPFGARLVEVLPQRRADVLAALRIADAGERAAALRAIVETHQHESR